MSTGTADIAAAVAGQAEWMTQLLIELVQAPTELHHEEPGQTLMAGAFAACGLAPRDIWLDAAALREHPNASPFSWEVAGKRNVVATWPGRGSGGRSLILNGHIDVVPPAAAELWSSPPYLARREGDWLYGRGAGDMKSGLVAIVGAVRALREAGVALNADVHLQSVVEEECTGNGALQCLIHGMHADACVLTEPHPDHLTIAQVGVLWFHVEVAGEPVHAAYATTGHNAIEAAHVVLASLRELEAELNTDPPTPYDAIEHPINLNPGMISGGDWTSTVAASATLSCRLAMYPGTDPGHLQRLVQAAVARAAQRDPFLAAHPPRVRYDGFVCEGSTVAVDEPLVQVLGGAYERVHGKPPGLRPTTATTDARHFVRSGIPAVCFGPRAERIHGIDERVSIASMLDCAEVLAHFICDWAGVAT
ncbi:MAG: acetylornithine deacetylase [Solirubrobacteraceae bacterium]|nr:acetylornithine deacetylase [Solirubrobacteraceae bacterium]